MFSTMVEQAPRDNFTAPQDTSSRSRHIPILPSAMAAPESPKGDAMDTTSPTSTMGPPNSSPEMEPSSTTGIANEAEGASGIDTSPRNTIGAAAAAAQGPKVVQTAFIHKLYKYVLLRVSCCHRLTLAFSMLEDKSIQHLISWSNTNESFVMSPSNEFSKVLS